jgi:hypothetical protein
MTMMFRTVKAALVTILGNASTGSYKVIGYQRQSTDADTATGTNRRVSVSYVSGSFPRSGSSPRGPVRHEMEFAIELLCSAKASGNLSALSNPSSTDEQKAAAIAAFTPAAEAVETQMDAFIDTIYQVLMNNEAIRLDDGTLGDLKVANRWISSVRKDDPMPSGALAVLTATLTYNVVAMEEITGAVAEFEPEEGETTLIVVDLLVEGDVSDPVEGDEEEGRATVQIGTGPIIPDPEPDPEPEPEGGGD